MTGAECLVKRLIAHNSDTVFGYPGAAVMSVYEALRRHRSEIKHIRTSHEQAAAHAADSYARLSGKPGICISTSGPGATNLVTGIANAFMDSVPVIFITANVERSLIGTDSFQEVDIVGITTPITKYSFTIRSGKDLLPSLDKAYNICMSGRKGPVLIDIPKDILEGSYVYNCDLCATEQTEVYSAFDVSDIVKCLNSASRPLLLIGGGVKSSCSTSLITGLCEKLKMPVFNSLMASDFLPRDFRYNLGLAGLFETDTLKEAISESDLIIACGTRFSNRIFKGIDEKTVSDKTLIHIDSDRAEINKIFETDYYICADASAVLNEIVLSVEFVSERQWNEHILTRQGKELDSVNGAKLNALNIFTSVNKAFKGEGIVITDVGTHQMLTASLYPFSGKTKFVTSGGLGTMGFGLGGVIGAYYSGISRNIVLFTGDGSFGMNSNELYTISANKIKALIVVFNNRKLGMVYNLQKERYGRTSETSHSKKFLPVKIAKSFGLEACRVRNHDEFVSAINKYMTLDKAMVIDYIVEGD